MLQGTEGLGNVIYIVSKNLNEAANSLSCLPSSTSVLETCAVLFSMEQLLVWLQGHTQGVALCCPQCFGIVTAETLLLWTSWNLLLWTVHTTVLWTVSSLKGTEEVTLTVTLFTLF